MHPSAPCPADRRRSPVLVAAVVAALVLVLACASGTGDDARTDDDGGSRPTEAAAGAVGAAGTDATATTAAEPAAACRDTPDDVPLDTQRQGLYPDRADVQAEDHEAVVGDCVRIAGLTAFVDGAAMRDHEFGGPQLVVTVTERNRDDRAKPYNLFDWRIQTPEGQVLDPTIPWSTDQDLGSGDLVPGGSVTGDVAFDVGPGTYFVIWKPNPFDAARGVWQVTVE